MEIRNRVSPDLSRGTSAFPNLCKSPPGNHHTAGSPSSISRDMRKMEMEVQLHGDGGFERGRTGGPG